MNEPLVTIICLTYNQEEYVRDCLEGFLSQQTAFPFEILIYDDASTDSTPDIIKQYVTRYPEIIKPTLYEKNNYSQGLGYVGLYTGIREARGKYVAYCEGDDYWCDSQKLQKQVLFLESNPHYIICAHETLFVNEQCPECGRLLFSQLTKNLFISTTRRKYSFEDSLTGNIFHISSLMYRNKPLILPSWISRISACDMVLYMLLAHDGDMYVLPDVMSVYRGHASSLTSSDEEYGTAIRFYKLSIQVLRLMNRFWGRMHQKIIYPKISRYYVECSIDYLRKSQRNLTHSIEMARMAWLYNKPTTFFFLFQGLVSKMILRICRR